MNNYGITVSLTVKGAACDTELQKDTHLALEKIIPYVQAAWNAVKE